MEIFYVLTKDVKSRLLQNCRNRERVNCLFERGASDPTMRRILSAQKRKPICKENENEAVMMVHRILEFRAVM